jgi:hypothetical protein
LQASEGNFPNASNQNIFGTSEGANNAINKGDSTFIFGVSKGANDWLSCSLHGFTTSFADFDSEQLNTQTHFDTDSVLFVCDNSTTGHICNEISKFVPGTLQQTNKSLTTANGTGPYLHEETVCMRVQDDMGSEHVFILNNCLYHPDSPVNLTQHLAEKFIDESDNQDEKTQIESWYSTHVLTWSFGQFQKTFPTPVSGLPELLLNKGYCRFKSFYQHTIMTDTTTDSNIIPYDDKELIALKILTMQLTCYSCFKTFGQGSSTQG